MEAVKAILGQLSHDDATLLMGELADTIRIVNPFNNIVLHETGKDLAEGGPFCKKQCHDALRIYHPCEDCVSMRAVVSRRKQAKIEFCEGRTFLVTALPVLYEGVTSAVEIVRDVTSVGYVHNLAGAANSTVRSKRLELSLLAKINTYINKQMALPDLLKRIAADLQAVLGVDETAIYLTHSQTWYSETGRGRGTLPDILTNMQIEHSKNNIVCKSFHWWRGLNEKMTAYLSDWGWAALVGVPIATSHRNYGCIVLGHNADPHAFRHFWLDGLHRLADQIAIIIEHHLLLCDYYEKQKLEADMRLAVELHQTLQPKASPLIPDCQVDAICIPAAVISGDYYDFLRFGSKTAFVMGDLKGKGMAAALLMVHLRSLVRAKAKMHRSPKVVINLINEFLIDEENEEMLASLVYGVWDHVKHTFCYCNAGHPYPLWYQAKSNTLQRLDTGGLMLGVFSGVKYEEASVQLAADDVLVFYTDGITEADNGSEIYGEARLSAVIAEHAGLNPHEISAAIIQSVKEFAKNSVDFDDRAVMVLKRLR